MPKTETNPSERLLKLVTGPGEDVYRATDLITIANAMADVEIKLAEYENDETNRRREDAHKIRTLEGQLAVAAEMEFKSALVDTGMLQSELLDVAGVSEEEFKQDWMAGWIEGLASKETTDEI